MKQYDPTDPDYYPRMKIGRNWFLIVPDYNMHDGCEFCVDDGTNGGACRLQNDGDSGDDPLFDRHDCGHNNSIFVRPSKFLEYLAMKALHE